VILVEKILFLRHVSLFSHMTSRELGRIAEIAEERVVPAGTTIIREGDHGDCMYVIVEGDVKIVHGGQELASLGPENYFGEMSILDNEPRSATAVASTDGLLLRITQKDFHGILARNFASALAIIKTLSNRLRAQIAARPPNSPAGPEKPDAA
jgi:CRP-like cAMP-binding protein